jgi:hypothetical protein
MRDLSVSSANNGAIVTSALSEFILQTEAGAAIPSRMDGADWRLFI